MGQLPPPDDSGPPATPEAGPPETGTPEAGTPETGTPEAGTPEAEPPPYAGPPVGAETPAYYSPPPAGPPPAPRHRSMVPLIVVGTAILLVIALAAGYVVIGYADAQTRLDKARTAYNGVVDHQNSLNQTVQSLANKLPSSNVTSATSTDLQQYRAAIDGIVKQSQDAQTQIATDDASLASANEQLNQDQWLTALRRSEIDKSSTRIKHLRAALAKAKIITADYVQIGGFFDAFFDLGNDFQTLISKSQAQDFAGIAAANEKIKTDVAKAIQLDKAPGLPTEIDSMLHDIQAVSEDITALLNAALKGDEAAFNAAETKGNADAAKVDAYDFSKIGDEIDAYYKPLIDSYNSEVDKANNS